MFTYEETKFGIGVWQGSEINITYLWIQIAVGCRQA